MDKHNQLMFDNLPEHIKELSQNLAVKQMQAEVLAKKVEDATAISISLRNDLEIVVMDLESLKADLRHECNKWIKSNENK